MGDVMCFLSRTLGLVPMLHYVDDDGSVDAPPLAKLVFDFFVGFNAALNLRTKPSKAQEPAKSHQMQGVEITMGKDQSLLAPDEQKADERVTLSRCKPDDTGS